MEEYQIYDVHNWTLTKARELCVGCGKCCRTVEQRIFIRECEMELFLEKGIRVYLLDNIGKHEPYPPIKNLTIYFDNEGNKIRPPALIEQKGRSTNGERLFMIYSDGLCPFFSKEKGCLVHEDERRPRVCKAYPIFTNADDPIVRESEVQINENCNQFNSPEIKGEFIKRFPGLRIS